MPRSEDMGGSQNYGPFIIGFFKRSFLVLPQSRTKGLTAERLRTKLHSRHFSFRMLLDHQLTGDQCFVHTDPIDFRNLAC